MPSLTILVPLWLIVISFWCFSILENYYFQVSFNFIYTLITHGYLYLSLNIFHKSVLMMELEDLGVCLAAEKSFLCFHSLMTLNLQTKGNYVQLLYYNNCNHHHETYIKVRGLSLQSCFFKGEEYILVS